MKVWKAAAIALIGAVALSGSAGAESEAQYQWTAGGKTVSLGKMATLDLGSEFVFLDADNTRKMLTDSHNQSSGQEIGAVFPLDEQAGWEVLFEYEDAGHISDEEKTEIDAKGILKAYREGTEKSNKERAAEDQLFVTGWDIAPFYEEQHHNLTWSMLGEDAQKQELVNYNVRLLTRTGYISAVLVSDPAHRAADQKVLAEQILPKLNVVQGQRYEDFNPAKDKVSKYGLTALILGGAGLAVAKKVGLLAVVVLLLKKLWIVLIIGFGVIARFSKGLLARFRNRSSSRGL
ncbi:DUF2167 domain-containing protein [Paenibacillus athensensis]|uniref:Membrane-anchored protein n=1 Tax=Paenibacillus athensensis TaxID=1967502 RepID=A0A4Y8PTQ8_9BACL|nr:DUF2167 domain-containing protein [Paenibacillus athensensis]MCD1261772.1 DUF2167 domain-containing protein [Paenibacillus athensensis]